MSSGYKCALSFDVGNHEKHRVEMRFDQMWGSLSISVDGQPVKRDLRMFSVSLVKTYELTVGQDEKHDIRIDKTRALWFAGFRPQVVRAYVDGQLVATDQTLDRRAAAP
ncbi:MAG TPA: hypothetical protein VHX87_05440 [Galbitalea sp.]|jgi:hypothetical protein|nr:hypothetical protein [Galbitalea sp.]